MKRYIALAITLILIAGVMATVVACKPGVEDTPTVEVKTEKAERGEAVEVGVEPIAEKVEEPPVLPEEITTAPEVKEEKLNPNMLYAYFYEGDELIPVECGLADPGIAYSIEEVLAFLFAGNGEYTTYVPEGVTYHHGFEDYGYNFYIALSNEILELKDNPEDARKALAQIEATVNWAFENWEHLELTPVLVVLDEDYHRVDLYEALGLR